MSDELTGIAMLNDIENARSLPEMELETLRSIYINELDVLYDDDESLSSVAIQLYPATADKREEQYVRMSLLFKLPEKYPDCIPEIYIRNPRGLSDEQINRISEILLSLAESKRGAAMLFELIEAAKEQLTSENRPSEECAICLYGFLDGDVFTKTECYHYFHCHCLSRYVESKLKEEDDDKKPTKEKDEDTGKIPCPVCRIPISFDSTQKTFPEPVAASHEDSNVDTSAYERQHEMALLYTKQLEQGGIIDVEAEKNKFLLEIANAPLETSTRQTDVNSPVSEKSNSVRESSTDTTRASPSSSSSTKQKDAVKNTVKTASKDGHREGEFSNRRGGYRQNNRKYHGGFGRSSRELKSNRANSSTLNNKTVEDKPSSREDEHETSSSEERCKGPLHSEGNSKNQLKGAEQESPVDERCDRRPGHNKSEYRNYIPNNRRGGYRNRYNNPSYHRRSYRNYGNVGSREPKSDDVHNRFQKRNEQDNQYADADTEQKVIEGKKQYHQDKKNWSELSFNDKEAYEESSSSKYKAPEKPEFERHDRPNHFRQRQRFSPNRRNSNRPWNRGEMFRGSRNSTTETINETSSTGYRANKKQYRQPPSRQYHDRQANGHSHANYSRDNYMRNGTINGDKACSITKDVVENNLLLNKPIDAFSNAKNADLPRNIGKSLQVSLVKSFQKCDVSDGNSVLGACSTSNLRSPPGFANPAKRVVYGLPSVNPPPGFHRS